MNKNKYLIILVIIYLILIILGFYLISNISLFDTFPLLIKLIYLFSIIINLQYIIYIITKNKYIKVSHYLGLFFYAIFMIITLYFRDTLQEETIEDSFYLDKWLKIVFSNKIVFLNLIGNIIIFIPFGIFFKQFSFPLTFKLLLIIIIIVMLELIQYVTKKGIFDYLDIALNIFGTFIGYIFCNKIKEDNDYEKSAIK